MIYGWLVLDGWAGASRQRVEVMGATRTRYRIRAIEETRLAGRLRSLKPGESAFVPKRAIRDNCSRCLGKRGGVPGNENIENGATVCDYCSVAGEKESGG